MKVLETAYSVLEKLHQNGFEAYIVGGAVRDSLLKQDLHDIDITTNARPHNVMDLFKAEPTGIKYGTVTIFVDEFKYEVTTFRSDGPSSNNRHPDIVYYGDNVREDVQRRDFTINGLLLNKNRELVDYVGGQIDLDKRLIKTIGNPYMRFKEDALRMLRAFYFQSKLDFTIDEHTLKAISEMQDLIKNLPSERVITELIKMLKGEYAIKALRSIVRTNLHQSLPGFNKGIEYLANQTIKPFNDTFFTLCVKLNNNKIDKYWKFSNQVKFKYIQAAKLATKFDKKISDYDLFTSGISLSLLANNVNEFLQTNYISREDLIKRFEELPIKSEIDLKLTSQEMIDIVGKKPGAWVSNYRSELAKLIIERKLNNNRDELIKYISNLEKGVKNV